MTSVRGPGPREPRPPQGLGRPGETEASGVLPRSRRLRLPDSPLAPGLARRVVSSLFADRGHDPESIEVATLLTSEVVTNAINHATPGARRRAFWLTVELAADLLRVEVHDPDPTVTALSAGARRPSGQLDENGRGLHLLAALAKDWGVRITPAGTGKTVWFTCAVPDSEPPGD